MRNKKAFTMVELLGTIVILGIISTIAVVGVRAIMKRMEENYYKRQERLILSAGINYYSDHKRQRPFEIGGTEAVTLETLENENI